LSRAQADSTLVKALGPGVLVAAMLEAGRYGTIDELAVAERIKTLVGIRGDGGTSHDQGCDEGAQEGFAPAPDVVHELEKAEIQRQLLLRDAPVRAQPGAQ
jgi:hypothetical protein